MGRKGDDTKARMIAATGELLETGGYSAAGLNQIVAASGAPRGSLYFHFPGGKDQLITESARQAGQFVELVIAGTEADDVDGYLDRLVTAFGDRMEASQWQKGCPIATLALDVSASNETIQRVCAEIYDGWERALATRLESLGRDGIHAGPILALVEGAMLLARVHRSREPLRRAGEAVKALL
ncbi:TetR/AcrR family transcriptional regulator [Nocardia mexicana]|uniref:TetR family transcriptional regulator n=1 Tax=Nocardia mexicana TaxID=279262 RepID=A0A370GUQ6_9NOCA|nr:TetR/AcrR family transcriptional regulator [Nocardia mexicana]RDI47229.1 TetR family transcriptional regulator [Nocardia mexicana]